MNKIICAIDQGTSSSRALLFDQDLNVLSVAQTEINADYPNPGWVQQDPEEIFASVVAVVNEALIKAHLSGTDISAIAITNQRETTIVWDKATGHPVYPALVWQSRQSAFYCEDMKAKGFEPFIKKRTGLMIDAYFSASKIRFILDEIEDGQARADAGELLFGTVDSWLVYQLTKGKVHVTDASNASRTLLMNIENCTWDPKLLAIWNIPENMLPKIVDTSGVVGKTDESWFNAEIPIAALVGDQQAALYGQLCLESGDVKNTYGTGCFLLMNTGERKIESKHGLVTTVAWRKDGKTVYALEGSVFVAGAAIQWLRDGLKMIRSSSETEAICKSVEDANGVIVVPSFVGLGAPYWKSDVKGAIFGLTLGTSDAHLIRATVESLAYQTADVVKAMEEDSGLKLKKLQVDGGASLNDFLMEFQAGLLNTEVIRPVISETTALGAALLGGLAVGIFNTEEELNKHWKADKSFTPVMGRPERLRRMDQWHNAIQAVLDYKEN